MKIAFVGASGYGNIGDDTYRDVFREQFPEAEVLFYNSDLPQELPSDIRLLALGGGGVLHNVGAEQSGMSHHFRCMRYYMDWALARGIPWGMLSCGFQFHAGREGLYATDLAPWVTYLRQAHFITLRSPQCVRIARELTGRTEGIHFFPDAAYLFRLPTPEAVPDMTPMLTLVPAGAISPHNELTRHIIRLFQSMDYQIAWLSMGAWVDDGEAMEAARLQTAGCTIVRPSSPQEALAWIARSRMVVSGRYHGMVFARSHRIPFFVPQTAPYKILQEDLSRSPAEAAGHGQVLRAVLQAHAG